MRARIRAGDVADTSAIEAGNARSATGGWFGCVRHVQRECSAEDADGYQGAADER